jgi:hypothetical protein
MAIQEALRLGWCPSGPEDVRHADRREIAGHFSNELAISIVDSMSAEETQDVFVSKQPTANQS